MQVINAQSLLLLLLKINDCCVSILCFISYYLTQTPLGVRNNAINVQFFGLNEINALKIAGNAFAALGPFPTILRALISLIPKNLTLIRY